MEIVKRLAAEFREKHARAGVRTTALVTTQVALRYAGTEEGRGRAIARTTPHRLQPQTRRFYHPFQKHLCMWGGANVASSQPYFLLAMLDGVFGKLGQCHPFTSVGV